MSDDENNDTPEDEETTASSDDTGPADNGVDDNGVDDGDDRDGVDGIQPIEIQEEMEQSFLDYAMSVIVSRALPDARDGLKPVHRRIIWGMFDGGHRPDRSHVKSARVVGDVMGRYHPHGDNAIYDAMVRMGQDFSLRHPLIDPHGNFGTPADGPAAMRYTEARLSRLAMHLVDGIDEDTVDFRDNFDGTSEEPEVLPSRFPNLLVNGSQGIAVGMATNIPPHNLGEVIDATLHLIDNPEATPDDLMQFVKGPDFPTGAEILGTKGIQEAYRTGRGSIKMRAKSEIVEDGNTTQIVVTEIPYQTSVENIAKKAAEHVENKTIEGIRNIIDQSSGDDTKLVFELKRDATPMVVQNLLYKHTPLQSTFSVNVVALDDNVPRTMNLRDLLVAYLNHQVEVLTRRSEYRLQKARDREHIVAGLIKAIDMIDAIIALIRGSEDRGTAREGLMSDDFGFSEVQATQILDMPLGRLTRLGRGELEKERDELLATIGELEAILADPGKLREVIREEMLELRDDFANPRRSALTFDPGEFDIEDLIDDEEIVFTMTQTGYVKTVSVDEFRTQSRGGRGVAGANLKEDDVVDLIIQTSAHAYLLFFTNFGKVYRLKAHQVPMQSRTARGIAIVNLLQLEADESVAAVIDTRDYETNRFLLFVTRKGQVKKSLMSSYDSNRQNGLWAIKLREGDELVRVLASNGVNDACIVTHNGRLMRFDQEEVRTMGRTAAGVRGIKLRDESDFVVSAVLTRPDHQMLLVTEKGYGKRTEFDEFNRKHRGGQGVRAIKTNEKKGGVVAALMVADGDEAMLMASNGVAIRIDAQDVSVQGASATGVTIMSLKGDETVVAVTKVSIDEDDTEIERDENGVPIERPEGDAHPSVDGDDAAPAASADDEGEEE